MFLIHAVEGGHIPAFEYLPAGAITPKVGMAMVQSGGVLAMASGDAAPAYISMLESAQALEEGELMPVIRVTPEIVFETEASVSIASVKLGDKLTIATDGMRVTATPGGAAEVVAVDGTEAGSKVRVRFA